MIFHWNRIGLPARTQSILAWAARAAILNLPVAPASAQPADRRVPNKQPVASARAVSDRVTASFPLVLQGRRRCADLETRVCEARQARIIARVLDGHTDSALALIDASVMTESWEHAVAACLRIYAHVKADSLPAPIRTKPSSCA